MKHDAGRDYLLFCDETGGSREGNVMCSIFLILLHLLSPNLIPFRVTGYFNDYRMQRGGGGGGSCSRTEKFKLGTMNGALWDLEFLPHHQARSRFFVISRLSTQIANKQ